MRTLSFIGLPRIDDDDDSAAISFSYLRAVHVDPRVRTLACVEELVFSPLRTILCVRYVHFSADFVSSQCRNRCTGWPFTFLLLAGRISRENESVRGTINVVIVSRTNSREGISIPTTYSTTIQLRTRYTLKPVYRLELSLRLTLEERRGKRKERNLGAPCIALAGPTERAGNFGTSDP